MLSVLAQASTADSALPEAIATVATVLVGSFLAPVVLAWVKGRRATMGYAWDTARDSQKELINSKNELIKSLMDDVDEWQGKCEAAQARAHESELKALEAEKEKLALVRRLLQYEDVTGHGKRRRPRNDPRIKPSIDEYEFPDW